MNAQDAANNVLIDLDAESQCDLLSDARDSPSWDCTVSLHDGVDEVFVRYLWIRPTPALGRKQ